MHICPHCHKLGIRSIQSPFNHGFADCRYCHNVSRARRNLVAAVAAPAAVLIAAIMTRQLSDTHLPRESVYIWGVLWFIVVGFIAAMLGDAFTKYDKYEPPKSPLPEHGKTAERTS
jgi:hypothetical protein